VESAVKGRERPVNATVAGREAAYPARVTHESRAGVGRSAPHLVAPLLLGLLPQAPGVTELRSELAGLGIHVSAATIVGWLAELSELGLVRVAGHDGAAAQYVSTTLGQRVAAASLSARPDLIPGLQELERLRGDLLATIAHELRTPLTAVRTSIGLLLDPALDPSSDERQRLLTTIGRSADRMQRLLEDLLDLARFRAGKIVLARRRFDARDLVREALMPMEPLTATREQRLDVSLPPDPVPITADRRRLEQALLNLLSNAAKFGPPGSRIEVTLAARDEMARIGVSDQGPGISEEDQARLFERFFVGSGDRAGGVGLGLPTALAIAQAHGGSIEVDSAPGSGSTFALLVPLAPAGEGRVNAPAAG
jgi:signal transduction histidine kinase